MRLRSGELVGGEDRIDLETFGGGKCGDGLIVNLGVPVLEDVREDGTQVPGRYLMLSQGNELADATWGVAYVSFYRLPSAISNITRPLK
jgi:hypothetical protein